MKYVILPKSFRISMRAHAFQRKEVLACIKGYRKTLRKHLIKLAVCDDRSVNHWLKEIQGFVDGMTDFSLKKGSSISKEAAYEQLVGGNRGNLDLEASVNSVIRDLREDYTLHENINVEQLTDRLYTVYDALASAIADKFSKGKKINMNQILADTNYYK